MSKPRNSKTALPLWVSVTLISAATSSTLMAQDAKPLTNGGALAYVGGTTRVGLGVETTANSTNVRGELSQIFGETDKAAWIGDIYASRDATGLKLTRGWVDGDWRTTASEKLAVTKVFAAVDQNRSDDRKLTLGLGRENQNLFWNTYLSHGLTKTRAVSDISRSTLETLSGLEGDRPFLQDVTTTVRSQAFARAYEWGTGARIGHFYDQQLLRITGGVDFDFGKNSARQRGVNIGVEKFFAGTPISVALTGDTFRKSGSAETKQSYSRGMLTLRYDLGGNTYRPTKQFKTTEVARTITEPPSASAVAAAEAAMAAAQATANASKNPGAPTQFKTERVEKTVRRDVQLTENFAFGASAITAQQRAELKNFVAEVKTSTCPVKIDVQAHACPYGPEQGNQVVSDQRARSIRDALVKEGFAAESISAVGLGGKNPAYARADARNRRADIQASVCSTVMEEVTTPIAAPAAAAPVVAPVAMPKSTTRTVMETKSEEVPVEPSWLRRALHSAPQHRQLVDTYATNQSTTTKTSGPRVLQNRCPVPADDTASTAAGTAATIDVLANDTDADRDTLTLQSVTAPANGTAVVSAGRVVYTPRAGFAGADTFNYTMTDGTCSKSAVVRVNVAAAPILPVVPAPVCRADSYFVTGIQPTVGINVLANDTSSAGALTLVSVTQPTLAGSRVAIGANNTVTFTPPGPFPQTTFTYTARDTAGGTCVGTVTLIDP